MALSHQPKTTNFISEAELRQFSIFNDVDLESVCAILNRCRKKIFKKGEVLLRPECGNSCMYLLLSGKVTVHLESLDAAPLLELIQGETIGEMSVFDGRNPSAYVKTSESCEMLVINSDVLWELIDTSHSLCRNLLFLLSNRLRSGNDIVTISKSKEREQQNAANSDALTGLNNRRWLNEIMIRLKGRELKNLMPMCVLMLDVDYFKRYNDTHGHKAGDVALQMVAQTLRKSIRPSDMVARYGGEEFAVLLPRTSQKQAIRVAERLRNAVSRTEITAQKDGVLPHVTISLGIAPVKDSESIEEVFEAADKALYQAKNNGRNRFEIRS